MKTRRQLTKALDRAYRQADAKRLCIGLGAQSEDDYSELDAILDRIEHLNQSIADHDARQAIWRRGHVAGLIDYRARHPRLGLSATV